MTCHRHVNIIAVMRLRYCIDSKKEALLYSGHENGKYIARVINVCLRLGYKHLEIFHTASI